MSSLRCGSIPSFFSLNTGCILLRPVERWIIVFPFDCSVWLYSCLITRVQYKFVFLLVWFQRGKELFSSLFDFSVDKKRIVFILSLMKRLTEVCLALHCFHGIKIGRTAHQGSRQDQHWHRLHVVARPLVNKKTNIFYGRSYRKSTFGAQGLNRERTVCFAFHVSLCWVGKHPWV